MNKVVNQIDKYNIMIMIMIDNDKMKMFAFTTNENATYSPFRYSIKIVKIKINLIREEETQQQLSQIPRNDIAVTLCEKCPNTEFFLVLIFLHSV